MRREERPLVSELEEQVSERPQRRLVCGLGEVQEEGLSKRTHLVGIAWSRLALLAMACSLGCLRVASAKVGGTARGLRLPAAEDGPAAVRGAAEPGDRRGIQAPAACAASTSKSGRLPESTSRGNGRRRSGDWGPPEPGSRWALE